ncbi:MAG: long-chain-fatty-acid--CoA/3-oxocholest-4-en-26-oate--CoA ligase [Acidimicrobiia bacterium]
MVWHDLARVVGDRPAIVCGDRAIDFATFDDRAARLASHLFTAGVRAGDRVAIDLTNVPEYLETLFAAWKIGAAPLNVNYRYVADEVRYVLETSGASVVVHAPEYAAVVAEALAALPGGAAPVTLETGAPYEAALTDAAPDGPWQDREPDGDDLLLLYTGGTTGMPKGVMWRNDDLYRALWQSNRPGTEPRDPVEAALAGKRTGTALPACPLMHGTGLFIALSTLAGSGTVVLIPETGLDPDRVWSEVERHRVAVLTIVGDVFARPLLATLDARPEAYDLSSLHAITSSGVTFSPDAKAGLMRHLPDVTIIDSLGSSEGIMTRSEARDAGDIQPARFAVNDRVAVLDEDTGARVEPGSGHVGLVAVTGPIPLGYWGDEEKSRATFRVYDGVRWSIPGDYATVEPDGSITLLGRGSACINTGGEKVYPEEVEVVLRDHPDVHDCVVVGVPDARFGETVVAVIVPEPGTAPHEDDLDAFARPRLAGYKRPRRYLLVDDLGRSAAGKASYRYLRDLAAERLGLAP